MDLPVGLASDVDVMEVTAVIFGVSSSQQQLTTGIGFWVPETHGGKTCCCSSPQPFRMTKYCSISSIKNYFFSRQFGYILYLRYLSNSVSQHNGIFVSLKALEK